MHFAQDTWRFDSSLSIEINRPLGINEQLISRCSLQELMRSAHASLFSCKTNSLHSKCGPAHICTCIYVHISAPLLEQVCGSACSVLRDCMIWVCQMSTTLSTSITFLQISGTEVKEAISPKSPTPDLSSSG